MDLMLKMLGVLMKKMRGTGAERIGSLVTTFMFLYAMIGPYLHYHFRYLIERVAAQFFGILNPYIQITIHEYGGDCMAKSHAYTSIKSYLTTNSSKQAKRLKADIVDFSKALTLSMDDKEVITDEYQGVKFWWSSDRSSTQKKKEPKPAYYKLIFHKKHREFVTDKYLRYVLEQGKAMEVKGQQRKLYTNNPISNVYGYKSWNHVVFDHPSTFRTLAMEAEKKKDIMDDLTMFCNSKEYYAKIGKTWKRGYLLYGPPGTGKSSTIAAMANFLNYDIYDLELTSVKSNTELRKLLIGTSRMSLIVIEDIDCSLDLTGQRKKKTKEEDKNSNPIIAEKAKEGEKSGESKVTLSGLLNFIDGLWSSCGGERIIVFTTNYVDELDPALIRRGRMDKHIELSYCSYGAFQVLAKNYLDLDYHHLFENIRELLGDTEMTPADVAENLMPKTSNGDFAEVCLQNLIQALMEKKEETKLKEENEAKEREVSSTTKDKLDADESVTKNEAKENDSGLLETEEISIKGASN